MVGIDKVLSAKEYQVLQCHQFLTNRQQHEKDRQTAREEFVEPVLSLDSSDDVDDHDSFATTQPQNGLIVQRKSVVTLELTATLDHTKIIYRSHIASISICSWTQPGGVGHQPDIYGIRRSMQTKPTPGNCNGHQSVLS